MNSLAASNSEGTTGEFPIAQSYSSFDQIPSFVPVEGVHTRLASPIRLKGTPRTQDDDLIEGLATYWNKCLNCTKASFSSRNYQFAQDCVGAGFALLSMRGTKILGIPCFQSLMRLIKRVGFAIIRLERANKRGGDVEKTPLDTLESELALTDGFEHRRGLRLDWLETINEMVEGISQKLTERETICFPGFLDYLPDTAPADEIMESMTPTDLVKFLPDDNRPMTPEEQTKWIERQIGKTMASIRERMRRLASLSDEG